MNLSDNRYSRTTIHKRFTFGVGVKAWTRYEAYTRYSYETHSKLFDIEVRNSDSAKSYHVNCGFAGEPFPIHKEIERHFGI